MTITKDPLVARINQELGTEFTDAEHLIKAMKWLRDAYQRLKRLDEKLECD